MLNHLNPDTGYNDATFSGAWPQKYTIENNNWYWPFDIPSYCLLECPFFLGERPRSSWRMCYPHGKCTVEMRMSSNMAKTKHVLIQNESHTYMCVHMRVLVCTREFVAHEIFHTPEDMQRVERCWFKLNDRQLQWSSLYIIPEAAEATFVC